jgi:hypothetical protein
LDSTGIPPLCAATQSPRRLRNYVVLGGGLFVMIAMLLALLLKESNGEFPARIGSKLNSPATPKAGSGQPSPGGSQSFGQFDDMNAKQIAEYINDNEEWRPRLSATQFDVFWRTIYSGVMREDYIVARECIRGPAFREWMARTRLPAEMREALLALRARLNGARPAGEPDTDYAAMRILEIVQHVSDELMPGENGNCQTVWREHVKKSLLRQEYALARANVDCLLRDFAPTTECRRAMLALRKKLSPSNRSAQ